MRSMTRMVAVLVAASLGFGFAQMLYTDQVVALYDPHPSAANSQLLGYLTVATPVDPVTGIADIRQDDDHLEVTFTGWSVIGADGPVFADMGVRILKATLTEFGVERLERLRTHPNARNWQEVSITGWIDRTVLVESLRPLWAEADAIYTAACSSCHEVPRPDVLTANEWPGQIRVMLEFGDPGIWNTQYEDIGHRGAFARLTDHQLELLTQYLQYHAKDR